MNRYIINLNLPPEERWVNLVTEYKDECINAFREMEKMIPLPQAYESMLENMIKQNMNIIMYKEELISISNILDMPLYKVIMAQLCYEMFSACTSVIVNNVDIDNPRGINVISSNVHYRTMDWDMPYLKKLTVELDFRYDDQTKFIATSWVGYIGIMTGMIPRQYSIALNYRRSDGTILGNVKRALDKYWPVGYLIRDIMEKNTINCDSEDTFDETMRRFEDSLLISPCYISICSSSGRNYIIVRDYNKVAQIKGSADFLVQTNIDPDDTNPNANILWSKERKALATKIIERERSSWENNEDVYSSFNKSPIINSQTIYTSIMIPKLGFMKSYSS